MLLSKFLFLHHNFPGQFRFVADYLADQGHDILFLTETNFVPEITKIKTLQVPFSKSKDSSVGRQLSTAESFRQVMISLLEEGYYPDFIISHSGWGCGLHSKEIFPNAKKVSYLEWWFSPHAKEYEYDNDGWCFYGEKKRSSLRYRNMPVSLELSESDFIVSPTKWQRDQLPKAFVSQTEVIHEGVDTNFFVMNTSWRPSDKYRITYATRGMEPMRAFPQFVQSIEYILQENSNVEIVIAGNDRVAYGSKLPEQGSFGLWAKEKLDKWIRLDKVKFVGHLDMLSYARLLKSSHVHCYLTRPFVASWSLLDAMASGCCLICSDVEPVRELAHAQATFWTDHRDPKNIAKSATDALSLSSKNREKIGLLQRSTAVEGFSRKQSLRNWSKLLALPH